MRLTRNLRVRTRPRPPLKAAKILSTMLWEVPRWWVGQPSCTCGRHILQSQYLIKLSGMAAARASSRARSTLAAGGQFYICATTLVGCLLLGGSATGGLLPDAILQLLAVPLLMVSLWRLADDRELLR